MPSTVSHGNDVETAVKRQGTNGRSIILMIGDGMGPEQVELARWVEVGTEGFVNMEQLPLWLSCTTYSADNPVTDSAASATAMATGNKTDNLKIALSPDGITLETILEIAKNKLKNLCNTWMIHHSGKNQLI